MAAKHTPGPWDFACDSYGKVLHSKKACVFTNIKGDNGDYLQTVAAKIENWKDARLIAAAPDLLAALKHLVRYDFGDSDGAKEARAAIAKAEGEAVR